MYNPCEDGRYNPCKPVPPEPPVCTTKVPCYPQPVPPINPGPMPCPPPDMPGYCPPPAHHPHHFVPPVPSVVEGSSLYEAVNRLTERVNLCIRTYNDVMSHGYKTLHDMQRAAEANGSYYTKSEVWTEVGYDADQGANYTLVHKAAVDSKNQPIRIKLHLAYGNTTNSQVPEGIFQASEQLLADKIVVAQPKQVGGWYGIALQNCTPIPSIDQAELYTMGFTRNGTMRVYSNTVSAEQMLADTVVDAMGVSGVLIQDGQLLDEAWINKIPQYDVQTSRVCVGQNTNTGEVIFIVTGKENDINKKGMTTRACAEILLRYGCTIAVELCEGDGAMMADKGQMMFTPADNTPPTAFCYWYITRRCEYRNDYQGELARMVQLYGQQVWQSYLNGQNILATQERINQEIRDREAGDRENLNKIKEETQRAEQAEANLQTNINAEVNRAMAAEEMLQTNINNVSTRVTQVESDLVAESDRAKAAEAQLQVNINNEVNRASQAEQFLQQNINTEVERATNAENALDRKFTTEVEQLQRLYEALTQQVTTMDQSIVAMQQTINSIESTLNGMKELIAESQRLVNEVNELLKALQTGDADIPYLPLKGGEMTGPVTTTRTTFEDNELTTMGAVTNITDPLNDEVATLKTDLEGVTGRVDTLETNVENINNEINNLGTTLASDFLPLTGGTVTGAVKTTQTEFEEADFTTQGRLNAVEEKMGNDIQGLGSTLSEITNIDTTPFVRKDGPSNVTGDITVPDPKGGTSVTNKNYVDATVNTALGSLSGDVTGVIEQLQNYVTKVGINEVTGDIRVPAPATDKSVVNKEYVAAEHDAAVQSAKEYTDTAIDGTQAALDAYLMKTGGTVTGHIEDTATSAPSNNTLVKKSYVTGLTDNINGRIDGITSTYMPKSGGQFTGNVTVREPAGKSNPATKQYADNNLTAAKNYAAGKSGTFTLRPSMWVADGDIFKCTVTPDTSGMERPQNARLNIYAVLTVLTYIKSPIVPYNDNGVFLLKTGKVPASDIEVQYQLVPTNLTGTTALRGDSI